MSTAVPSAGAVPGARMTGSAGLPARVTGSHEAPVRAVYGRLLSRFRRVTRRGARASSALSLLLPALLLALPSPARSAPALDPCVLLTPVDPAAPAVARGPFAAAARLLRRGRVAEAARAYTAALAQLTRAARQAFGERDAAPERGRAFLDALVYPADAPLRIADARFVPVPAAAAVGLHAYCRAGDLGRAVALARRVATGDADAAGLGVDLAWLELRRDRPEAAAAALRATQAGETADPRRHAVAALLAARLGDTREAAAQVAAARAAGVGPALEAWLAPLGE